MPARLIDLHDNKVRGKGLAHLLQKEIHHGCRGFWQNQRDHLAKSWSHSGIGIHIFSHELSWDMRADAERGPTAFHLTDPAKTPLILRHDEDRAFIARFARVNCCIHQSGKVFLKRLLRLQIAFRMLGPRHHLAPAMPIEQAIDGAVIDTVPDALFKSSPDLPDRGDLPTLGLRQKGSEEFFFFFHRQILPSPPPFPDVSIAATPKRL